MSPSDALPQGDKPPHRSSLLGQRKKRLPRTEKPQALGDLGPAVAPAAPPPPAEPTPLPQAAPRKKPDKEQQFRRRTGKRLDALTQQVTSLTHLLEHPVLPPNVVKLEKQLQSSREEAEELSGLMSDLETQLADAHKRLERMEREAEEDRMARRQLEKLLHSGRHRLEAEQNLRLQGQQRLHRAESLLREALLALLSPGDEFQDQLVDEVQQFLEL